MPPKERSLVRGIAIEAWKDMWKRPLMILILTASSLPLIFLFYFLVPGSPQRLYIVFLLVGYSFCFALHFMFWCMAVFLYDGDARGKKRLSYGNAYSRMLGWSRPSLWPALISGLILVFAFTAAQLLVSFALSFLAGGEASTSSLVALTLLHFYFSYLVADLLGVLIVLVPQMLCLEGGRKVEEVFRTSYYLIKERYRDALVLFIIPEIVIRTIFLGASFAIYYVPATAVIFTLLLLSMSLLEGARTAFVAASFNRFYYHILEEEKKKRKGKGKGKKQDSRKQPPKKQPTKKQTSRKQAAKKQTGKKQTRKKR